MTVFSLIGIERRWALDDHIELTPGEAGARPRIGGRRISVQDIAIWYERLGKRSADEIAAEYELTTCASRRTTLSSRCFARARHRNKCKGLRADSMCITA
jgi:uncharacterized protein (DUF433 family)